MTRSDDDLARAFRRHWRDHYARGAGPVIAAVSGGLDSMTMLALLTRVAEDGDVEVVAAHFDHGTRGDEGAEDGRLVEAVARRWGVRTVRGRGDAPARAEATGHGPQAAARQLRYAFLDEVAEATGADRIATAHHRDDRVETVLLRIVRGTSPGGLRGPAPLEPRDGATLVRPLLPFSRAAIERWGEREGVPFREDPSNRDPRYPRSRIRSEVVPLLRELNPRVDEAVVRLGVMAAADAAYLESEAADVIDAATEERGPTRWRLAARDVVDRPDPILSRVVLAGWAAVARAESAPPGAEWVEGAMRFLRGGGGGAIPAPGDAELARTGPTVEFRRAGTAGLSDPSNPQEEDA